MSIIQQITIGQITTSQTGSLPVYSISCNLGKTCKVRCVLLDEQGVNLWKQNSRQPKGHSTINLQLPPLSSGTYNCWIKVEDQMHLRQLHVATEKRKGLLGQLMKHFN